MKHFHNHLEHNMCLLNYKEQSSVWDRALSSFQSTLALLRISLEYKMHFQDYSNTQFSSDSFKELFNSE